MNSRFLSAEDIPISAFCEKVDIRGPDECWNWKGPLVNRGYGRFWLPALKTEMAIHRISYALAHDEVAAGLTIDHLCRNRGCVNPRHLEQVTNKVNILRGQGPTAIYSQKTHCIRGHALTPDNLRPYGLKAGVRICKICDRMRIRRWKAKRRKER